MPKSIMMPIDEYNTEITKAKSAGVTQVVNIVRDLIENDGKNTDISEDADPEFLKFLDEIKKLKEGKK